MSRSDRLYLEDIKTSCEKVVQYVEGTTYEQFVADRKTLDAVAHNLVIIGEAVNHLPERIIEGNPDVEWHRIIGLRNLVVHGYFGMDDEIIWDVTQKHVPRLLLHVEEILASI